MNQTKPSASLLDFVEKIKTADGVILVTPEYNGGYPAALKNVVDVLNLEWRRKPVAFPPFLMAVLGVCRSSPPCNTRFGNSVPDGGRHVFRYPKWRESFDAEGNAADQAGVEKRAAIFLDEFALVHGSESPDGKPSLCYFKSSFTNLLIMLAIGTMAPTLLYTPPPIKP